MDNNKTIREPKQKRSVKMKENILNTSKILICQKGYHNVTTNEIAKVADISIGSLYSYFKDKDAILMELVEIHNRQFLHIFQEINEDQILSLYKKNKKEYFRYVIDYLVRLHETDLAFNYELDALYYTKVEIKKIVDEQMKKIVSHFLEITMQDSNEYKIKNFHAAAIIVIDFLTTIVTRIVYKKNDVDNKQIKEEAVDMLCKYLFHNP